MLFPSNPAVSLYTLMAFPMAAIAFSVAMTFSSVLESGVAIMLKRCGMEAKKLVAEVPKQNAE